MKPSEYHDYNGGVQGFQGVVVVVEVVIIVAHLDYLDRQYTDQPSGENFMNRRIWYGDI